MKSRANNTIQRPSKLQQAHLEGPNWMLVVGGALLSTLSIRLVWKLKQAFETKRSDDATNTLKAARRRSQPCQLRQKLYSFGQDDEGCYQYNSAGTSESRADMKHIPTSPVSKDGDRHLPLVAISIADSNKDNGVMWASSPERLELPPKPFHHSNTSDSPCVSESGSDIFIKREVIQKLRRQLKRRDEMILEMQSQITELQKSLSAQIALSTNLQSQLDCAHRELFDSERDIQRLRKAITDHCVADAGSTSKPVMSQNWPSETANCHAKGYTDGYANGFAENVTVAELNCTGSEKGRDSERVEMLKREVGELKEVIEGKEFLLRSYKEQKSELCTKVKELQLRLASQSVGPRSSTHRERSGDKNFPTKKAARAGVRALNFSLRTAKEMGVSPLGKELVWVEGN